MIRIGTNVDITYNDVIKAIEHYDREGMTDSRAKSGFIIYDGKSYPARKIGVLALSLREGMEPKEIKFHGGEYAVRYLENLGFEGKYLG